MKKVEEMTVEERLKALNEWVENSWYEKLVERGVNAEARTLAHLVLNSVPENIREISLREQSVGEVRGLERLGLETIKTLRELKEQNERRQSEQPADKYKSEPDPTDIL